MRAVLKIGVCFLALQAFGTVSAFAQEASAEDDASGLEVVTVTAQRRTEDLQKAALSVTAVTGEALVSRGISQTEDLATLTAGLQVQPSAGPYTTFSVRSVSQLSGNAFADPAVAANINGVYLATPTVIHGLYYDLQRVEILKGPQGTLYGRNATAGAINIIPNRPTFDLGGTVTADIGDYSRFNVGGALNVPLSETVAVRIAGQNVHRDGFMSDGTSDDVGYAFRGGLLFQPTDNLSILLSGDFAHQGGKGPGATFRKTCASLGRGTGSCFVDDPYTAVSDLQSFYTAAGLAVQTKNGFIDGDYYGFGLNVDLLTDFGTVTFVGGWRQSDMTYVGTGIGWQIREHQEPTQTSAELRLASDSDSRFQYVFGAYYLETSMDARANGENAQRRNFSDQDTHLTGWTGAVFTELSYGLTDTFRLVGGARYTYEEKESNSRRYTLAPLVGPDPIIPAIPGGGAAPANIVIGTREWNKTNWKAGFEFDAGPDSLLYANVSTGFKAGGFFYGPPGAQTYEPEEVTAYVLGSKNRFLDNRLQLNAEAFYMDYQDQQVSFVKLIGVSSTLVTENAGQSHAYGVELEADYLPVENTRLGAQLQWLDATYDEFSYQTIAPPPASSLCSVAAAGGGQFNVNCEGVTPLRSPEWTAIGTVEQTFPLANGGRIVAEALARFESGFDADVSYIPETRGYDTTRIDLGLSWVRSDDAFTLKAYVNNVTDEVTISSATMSNAYPVNQAVGINLLAPRTWGIRASANF